MLLLKENPNLSIANLINIAKKFFGNIKEEKKRSARKFDLSSFLMSGLAIFYLKESSLLAYDYHRGRSGEENLKTLFHIDSVPSDTHFREIVDRIDTSVLMELFRKYVELLKNNNILKEYSIFHNYILVSIDGTGFFQSDSIHCANCIQRKMRDGNISYCAESNYLTVKSYLSSHIRCRLLYNARQITWKTFQFRYKTTPLWWCNEQTIEKP